MTADLSESKIESKIRVQLPDGSIREVPSGTTPLDIATQISPRLAAAVVVARIKPMAALDINQAEGGQDDAPAESDQSAETMYAPDDPAAEKVVDLTTPLTEDVELQLLKEQDEAALKVLRHSTAHVMATAILELFPETKLGHGPATEQGFFYDVYRQTPFTEDDLAAIETRMAEVVARNEPFVRETESREAGIAQYQAQAEFMKVHFIERFTQPGDEISLYRNGAFTDFCRGPHIPSTGRVKAFKVTSVAGAYWLGDEKNQQLQRIYGTAFFNDKDLKAHFARLEEIKARDHRVLGKQLDLFSIQEVAGAGLIFWHPKGGLIRKTMEDWMRDECIRRGYKMVYTPHIMRRELWQDLRTREPLQRQHVPPDGARRRRVPPQAHELPRPHPHLQKRTQELSRPAPALRRARQRLSLRALRHHARTLESPRLHPGRRPHLLHAPTRSKTRSSPASISPSPSSTPSAFKEFKVELSTWDPAKNGGLHRQPRGLAARHQLAPNRPQPQRHPLQDHPRRSRLLRPQDRH